MHKTRKLPMSGYLMGAIVGTLVVSTLLSGCLFKKSEVAIPAGAGAAVSDELAAGLGGATNGGGSGYDPNATSISYGAVTQFNTSRPYDIKSVKLTSTKSVILFRDMATGGRLKAAVADVVGTASTIGPKQSIDDNCTGCTMASIAALSSSRIVVAYPDTNNGNHGTARTCDVSGTTITCNANAEFSSGNVGTGWTSIAALDSGKFVVGYFDDGTTGKVRVGLVNPDGTLSYGTAVNFETGMMMVLQASAALSPTQFVLAYEDGTNMYGRAVVGTVSGSTITVGVESTFSNQATSFSIAITPLSATTVAIAYVKQDSYGAVKLGTVGGAGGAAGLMPGTEAIFSDNIEQDLGISTLASDKFVVSGVNNNIMNYGQNGGVATIGKVSGNTITLGWGYRFHTYGFSKPAYTTVQGLSDKTFLTITCDKEVNKGATYLGTVSAI